MCKFHHNFLQLNELLILGDISDHAEQKVINSFSTVYTIQTTT